MSDYEYEYEDEEAVLGSDEEGSFRYSQEELMLGRQESAVSSVGGDVGMTGAVMTEADVNEINDNCDGVHAGFWEAGPTICVWIAMEPSRFLLDRERSLAWGIQPDLLVCFEVRFDKFYTNSTTVPTVTKAYQMSHEELEIRARVEVGFGLSWMLMDRANAFLRGSVWPPYLIPREVESCRHHELMDMFGVSEAVARAALEEAKGDYSDATVLLMNDKSRIEAKCNEARVTGATSLLANAATSLLELLHQRFPSATEVELVNAMEASGGNGEVAESILTDHFGPSAPPTLMKQDSNAQAMMDHATIVRTTERPYAEKNFLLQLVHSVEDTLRTCNQRCLVCNDPVEYVGLRPVVCAKELCIMGYEELGVGLDVAAEILRDPDVMDLMITMLYCACKAGRIELAFPDNVRALSGEGHEESFMIRGAQDRERLTRVVDLLPSVSDMVEFAQNGRLRDHLHDLDPLLYPLLRWLISSNRAHLRRLQPEEEVQGLGTSYQFVLMTGPVERESSFQQLKTETATEKGQGSIFAFHGSAVGNWHSILRMGLKNYSNTKYMSAGAAYGVGVYFATQMATSLGYSVRQQIGWSRSRFGSNCTFMALCELINRPEHYTTNSDNIIVVPREEYITTRYFLVNPTGSAHSMSLQIHLPNTVSVVAKEGEVQQSKRKRSLKFRK